MQDPYLYPRTEVLINKFQLTEENKFRDAEADYVILCLAELVTEQTIQVFDFEALCRMHYQIFRDVFDWAGKPRVINIEKAEAPLGGLSVEYADVFDVEEEARIILAEMNQFEWEKAAFDEVVRNFTDYMARLWKVHPFREGNTRTIVTYCAMFIEAQGIIIDSELFQKHIDYMRQALAAASAVFQNLGDLRKPEYLQRIVRDALERGRRIQEDAAARISRAGYQVTVQSVRKVVFWDRQENRPHGEEEIRRFLQM